jgi:UDPglucose 6-dehydrogenase
MKIGVIGAGYVGLVTAACFAEKGNEVVVMDVNEEKINSIKQGITPFYEPGLDEILKKTLQNGNFNVTLDLKKLVDNSEVIFIAVGTPQGESNVVDTRWVFDAADSIGKLMKENNDFKLIVVKSTVPPGTNREVINIISRYRNKDSFAVASNPEFLKEGSAISDFRIPDRVIVGTENENAEKMMKELYLPFIRTTSVEGKLMFMSIESAELSKYLANSMLAARIGMMNEAALLAHAVGANIDEVRIGVGSDSRIGNKFLFPGPGFGGSCFPKDIRGLIELARDKGVNLSILEAVDDSNNRQRYWLADSVRKYFNGEIRNKTIAIWGVAFKPRTDDVRESPAIYTVIRLLEYGAKVRVHDPEKKAMHNFKMRFNGSIEYSENVYDVLDGCSALLIVTDWDDFKAIDLNKVKSKLIEPVIFDARNLYNLEDIKKLGIDYISLGRPKILKSKVIL